MSGLAIAASAGLVTIAAIQPQVDPGVKRAIAIKPIPLADGIMEFERTCLSTNFEQVRFDTAVAQSRWSFRAEQGVGTPTPQVRRAAEAIATFHDMPAQETGAFAPGQCNMEFYARAETNRETLLAALAPAVTRAAGTIPQRYEFAGETCWRWPTDQRRIRRMCLLHWPGPQSRHVALSYQLWSIDGEARAHLTPPGEKVR